MNELKKTLRKEGRFSYPRESKNIRLVVYRSSVYIGEVQSYGKAKDKAKHGLGIYATTYGTWYEGEWKHGKRHGRGRQITKDSKVYTGMWNNDEKCE